MPNYQINIQRLSVSLHGVSTSLIEQAGQDLESELRRQLGTNQASQRGAADPGGRNLGPINITPTTDGATLRSLIAERLSIVLQGELQASEKNEVTGP